jgi:methyl-accepting chemotaxis protein
MFEKTGIGVRLIVLVAALLSALVAIGAMGLRGMALTEEALERTYDSQLEPIAMLSRISTLMSENARQVALGIQHDPASPYAKLHDHPLTLHMDAIDKNRDEITALVAELNKRDLGENLKLPLAAYAEARKLYVEEGLVPARTVLLAGEFDKATPILLLKVNPHYAKASGLAREVQEALKQAARDDYAAAQASYAFTRNLGLALVALAVLLGVGLALWIVRSITGPLARLQDVTGRVEQSGDLSLRTNISSQDEVGRTAAAFDRMMAKIAALIGDTRQSAEAIAAAAHSMATAGAQVEQSSAAQSEAASAVAAAVEQTSVSISETAGNAHTADETAARARADIGKTLAAVRETADNVDKLAGMIDEASGDIVRLAESSRQIDGIVQTIKDIADQTNLLALNAAIEAARAGEQGRGFAVVADEVRKLAENTTKATSEISGLIGGIQTQVDGAVGRMREANEKAGATRAHVVASTSALDAASADTGRVTESVRNIADAVREQDVAVQQVAQRIEQIAQMTEENTAAAANAADTARQLDGLAGNLRAAVGKFRV